MRKIVLAFILLVSCVSYALHVECVGNATIIDNNEFYCPECHEIKNIYSYKKENGYLYCDCGASYTFDECKLQYYKGSMRAFTGDIYFDEDKISISIIKGFADTNRFNKYYWSTGAIRATINLKTGYSYQSNTGCCYNDFNKNLSIDGKTLSL